MNMYNYYYHNPRSITSVLCNYYKIYIFVHFSYFSYTKLFYDYANEKYEEKTPLKQEISRRYAARSLEYGSWGMAWQAMSQLPYSNHHEAPEALRSQKKGVASSIEIAG
jgi:hypothetical protein